MGPDPVALLARLVAVPSIAGGPNGALVAEVGERLEDAGATVTRVAGTRPGVELIHAVLGPADAPGGILLAAHGDVVDVAGQEWTGDPFTLRRAGGRLHGRGTSDMKGFLAAALAALGACDPSRLRAPLHLALSHDEELGCAGTGPLLDHLATSRAIPAPLAGVLVGEPTGLGVIDRHKGKAAFRITVHGRAAHSATPAAGVNAVRAAAHLLAALDPLERELAREANDAGFTTPHATLGIGPIHGGVALNIVPETCTVEVEARVLPGQSTERVHARLRELAAGSLGPDGTRARVEVERVAGYPPLDGLPAEGDPARAAFAMRVARAAGTGRPPGGAVDFGTEAGLYAQRLRVPVLVCGPGSMAQGHTPDEFIEERALRDGVACVAALLEELGGDPGETGDVARPAR